MGNAAKVTIAASLILAFITLLAGLTYYQNADATLRGINSTIFATSVHTSYDMAKFTFNATLSNTGQLDIHLSYLEITITIGGTSVYTGELDPITVKSGSSITVALKKGILAVPVAGESFEDIGAGMIRLGIIFKGVASAGGLTRDILFSGSGSAAFWNRP